MRTLALRCLPLLAVTACGGTDVTATSNMVETTTPVAASDAGQGTLYRCADGKTVLAVFTDPETLTLHIGDRPIDMRAAPAKDGARYIGARWQWWAHGLQQASLAPLKHGETVATTKGVACTVS